VRIARPRCGVIGGSFLSICPKALKVGENLRWSNRAGAEVFSRHGETNWEETVDAARKVSHNAA